MIYKLWRFGELLHLNHQGGETSHHSDDTDGDGETRIFHFSESSKLFLLNQCNDGSRKLFRKAGKYLWAGIAQSVSRLATGWTVIGSNPGRREIFRTRPDRHWVSPSLLQNGYRLAFPGVKRPGRGVNHPPPSSTEVKERTELYFYSPAVSSWSVLGRTLPLPFKYQTEKCEVESL
jgi:hypothetical protein